MIGDRPAITAPRDGSINASPTYCDVGLVREPDATVVTVTGEVDLFAGPSLFRLLKQALSNAEVPVVVDLSDCTFFESSGLNALLSADLDPRRDGSEILVVRTPESCADRVLSLTVPGHFAEHESRDAALAAVAA